MVRGAQLVRNLAAVVVVFLFLQLTLILRNSCDNPGRNHASNCSSPAGKPYTANTAILEEKTLEEIQQAQRMKDLLNEARMEFIEQNADRPIDSAAARMYGVSRSNKGFLTIGIPSIGRANVTYLVDTVASLTKHANPNERKEIVVVVFLSDFNQKYREEMAKQLNDMFSNAVAEGFIHIIQAPRKFYPNMESLERTFGDKEERVKWRSKQNYDYAFLMKYSQPLSEYYMQLEDDVVTVPSYLTHIKQFIKKQKKHWSCLEFSDLGFIGKLFPSDDIGRLAKFLMVFFDQQPVDLLFPFFFRLMTQPKPIVRRPSLFQHMGARSSLQGHKNNLKDKYFNAHVKELKGDNPAATVYTNLEVFSGNTLDRAYDKEDNIGYFWGKTPKKGDWIYIIFEAPQDVQRLSIITGNPEHPGDRLRSALVEISPKVEKRQGNDIVCSGYRTLGGFITGKFDNQSVQKTAPFPVACVRVTVGVDQETWLIIREIAVFIAH